MNIALCIMLDDNFMVGFITMWKSFIYHNPWFLKSDYTLVVIDVGLSEDSMYAIAESYPEGGIVFGQPDKSKYSTVDMGSTAEHLKNTYYTLELFTLDYDRIVFLDCDIIVKADIKELFECYRPIAGVRCYDSSNDILREEFNAGVFVINKEYLNETTYKGLLKTIEQGFSMPEQKAMNIYFKNRIHFLDKRLNVEKRMLHTEKFKHVLEEAKIIHFVAKKPWESNFGHHKREHTYGPLEEEWHRYSNILGPG